MVEFAHEAAREVAVQPPRRLRHIKLFNTLISRLFPVRPALARSVPGQLMDRAEASAGTDPRRAAELRRAAIAYLGVVR